MSDRTIQLTRRRLLGGILALGGASAASGAGTMAYFSDSETSSNDVVAGTLTLEFGGSGAFTFTTSLAPTESVDDTVTLVNGGNLAGSLDVDVSCTENDASNAASSNKTADEVAQTLEVETLEYGGADVSGQIDASGSTPTLYDLANTAEASGETVPNDLVDLADPGAGTDFTVAFRLKNVSDDYQGHGVDVEFTFHLNQNDGM